MPTLSHCWPWLSLAALGAFHGLNPAMGWLFAVALGLARAAAAGGRRRPWGRSPSVMRWPSGWPPSWSAWSGLVIPQRLLLALGGAALLGFAAYKVATRFRHPRWVGMRVGPRELVLWSFLMASAHGAGLMLVPVLAGLRGEGVSSASAHADEHLGHIGHQLPDGNDSLLPALAAVGLHSAAMLAVAGVLAVVVYQKLGVEVLRRAWVNLDLIWVGALVVVGGLALGLSLWPVLAG